MSRLIVTHSYDKWDDCLTIHVHSSKWYGPDIIYVCSPEIGERIILRGGRKIILDGYKRFVSSYYSIGGEGVLLSRETLKEFCEAKTIESSLVDNQKRANQFAKCIIPCARLMYNTICSPIYDEDEIQRMYKETGIPFGRWYARKNRDYGEILNVVIPILVLIIVAVVILVAIYAP